MHGRDKDQECRKQIMVDGTRTRRRSLVGPRRFTFLFYWRTSSLSVRLLLDNRTEPNRAPGSRSKDLFVTIA